MNIEKTLKPLNKCKNICKKIKTKKSHDFKMFPKASNELILINHFPWNCPNHCYKTRFLFY